MKDEKLVACLLDMGEILLTSGAEINRIEDTITRMGMAYHFKRVDVFTITYSIILTVETAEEEVITQTRRIKNVRVDMERVHRVNRLSRVICEKTPDTCFIVQEIDKIRRIPMYSEPVQYLAYVMVASSFTLFFGGSIMDAVASAAAAVILRIMQKISERIHMNTLLSIMMCSAAVGITVMLLTRFGMGDSVDAIVIGNIMLLIPGLSFTTALRDMISGDIISGLLEMTEAFLKAAAIALGFAVLLIQI